MPLYEYFGWDPANEEAVVAHGLTQAWLLVRDAAAQGLAKAIDEKIHGDGGLCPTSQHKHHEHCLEVRL